MAQVDYDTANQSGASFRTDLNTFWDAIVGKNSGATEPTTKFAFMWWLDTTTGLLKMRNAANNAWVEVGDPELANFGISGSVVKSVHTQTGEQSQDLTPTAMGFDDSIPQNTEGLEVMTRTITPDNSSNILVIEVITHFSTTGLSNTNTMALFKDSIANAIATVGHFQSASNRMSQLVMRHEIAAGSTSLQTFKVRIGADGTDDLYFNNILGARKWGGTAASSIRITEYLP